MSSPGIIRPIVMIGAALLVVAVACLGFMNLNPRARLENEHGLLLPASATDWN